MDKRTRRDGQNVFVHLLARCCEPLHNNNPFHKAQYKFIYAIKKFVGKKYFVIKIKNLNMSNFEKLGLTF